MLERSIQQCRDGICIYDMDGRIQFINFALSQMLGYSASELIGKQIDIFYPHQQEDKDIANFIREIKESGSYQKEFTYMKKGGELFPVEMTATLVRDEGSNPMGFIEIVRDISKHQRDQKKLEILNKELLGANRRLRRLSLRDYHTGLYNHHYMWEALDRELSRAKRYGYQFSVIMLDIDYFRSINNTYGRQFGDTVLKQFASFLKRITRQDDIVVQFGGEEFVILSLGINRSQGYQLAQRILDALHLYNFGNKEHIIKLKITGAVISYPEDNITESMSLIKSAEEILNRAKREGGNRIFSSMDTKRVLVPEESKEMAEVESLRNKIEELTKQANQSVVEFIFGFVRTIELKDHYTGEHAERSVYYAVEIARRLNLPEDEIENIRQAAILHDLGKIGISENLLHKKTKLTKKEFAQIKKHSQIGVDIIRPIQSLHALIPLILYHHERWDGKGYPEGLKQTEIPVGARIISVADVYQALISKRSYRKAYSKEKTIEIIKNVSGTQFDPKISSIFLKILKEEADERRIK